MKSKSYWCFSDEEKFDWALKEHQQRGHEYDLLVGGRATIDFIKHNIAQRRAFVQLSCQEVELIMKNMNKALNVVKKVKL
jgi:hypothetical protein